MRLAESGRSVLVLEAADTIGGGTRSARADAARVRPRRLRSGPRPGRVGACALARHARPARPALGRGPRSRWPIRSTAAAQACCIDSVDETAAGLGVGRDVVAAPDADRSSTTGRQLLPQLLGPVLTRPAAPVALARFGLRALQPATLLARRFKTDEGAALFGGCAAHAMLSLTRPLTSAFGLTLAASAHAGGWPVAAGGSQAVADALAAGSEQLGGEVRTGHDGSFARRPATASRRAVRHEPGAARVDRRRCAAVPISEAAAPVPSRARRVQDRLRPRRAGAVGERGLPIAPAPFT